jgi:thioredoxin reductase
MNPAPFDVVIVGGGPAGLSAALMLGRCRRRVVVCDDGRPRNGVSKAAHGLFTRDGASPHELLRAGREQLSAYGVELVSTRAVDARVENERFVVGLASHREIAGRRLLLATGLVDELPAVDGADALYGTSVFHCPYCDGWEHRDQPLAVYCRDAEAAPFALAIENWSADVVLCTDGATPLSEREAGQLARRGIAVHTQPIRRLEGHDGMLEQIVFANGTRLARSALFFDTRVAPRCDLAVKLGCALNEKRMVRTDKLTCRTAVAGLYVTGDASEDLNFLSIAVAEGTKAAVAIHKDLRREDLGC